jgi:hypothetical protein
MLKMQIFLIDFPPQCLQIKLFLLIYCILGVFLLNSISQIGIK